MLTDPQQQGVLGGGPTPTTPTTTTAPGKNKAGAATTATATVNTNSRQTVWDEASLVKCGWPPLVVSAAILKHAPMTLGKTPQPLYTLPTPYLSYYPHTLRVPSSLIPSYSKRFSYTLIIYIIQYALIVLPPLPPTNKRILPYTLISYYPLLP